MSKLPKRKKPRRSAEVLEFRAPLEQIRDGLLAPQGAASRTPLKVVPSSLTTAQAYVDPSRLFASGLFLPYNPSVLVTRKGLKIFDSMALDEQVKICMAFKTLAVLAPGWEVKSPSDQEDDWEVRQFVADIFKHLPGGFSAAMKKVLRALRYGYCLRGDTLIHTLSGDIPIEQLVGKRPWVFAWDGEKVRLGRARRVWRSRQNAECLRVTYKWWANAGGWKTDSIVCTGNHPFMLRDGSYCAAAQLKPGYGLMPFSQKTSGRATVQTRRGQGKTKWERRSHWVMRERGYEVLPTDHVHHRNEIKLDDRPENLEILDKRVHTSMHSRAWFRKATAEQKAARVAKIQVGRAKVSDQISAASTASNKRTWADPEVRARRIAGMTGKKHKGGWHHTEEAKAKIAAARRLDNHKVLSVEPAGRADVFDMEVPSFQNFSANHVVVHNSITEKIYTKPEESPPWAEGKVVLKKLTEVKPHYFDFDVDAYGEIIAVVQVLVPGAGGAALTTAGNSYPPDKFVIYAYDQEHENPYGKSDLEAAYRCYSADTEVLTKQGWMLVGEVSCQDEVAVLDDNGFLQYQLPERTFSYDYVGKMFHQQGKTVDLLVTPNHNMWVQKERDYQEGRGFHFMEAQHLPRHVRFKRDAKWKGREQKWFVLPAMDYEQTIHTREGPKQVVKTLPEIRIPMDAWLWVLGIYIAEGCVSSWTGYALCIYQNPGPKLNKIIAAVRAAGLHAQPGKRSVVIQSKQLWSYLKVLGKSGDKYIPAECKELSRRQIRILIDALLFGDGRGTSGYCTISRRLADDVQELFLKAGYAGSVIVEKVKAEVVGTRHFGVNDIYYVSRHTNSIGASRVNSKSTEGRNRNYISYKGKVHCLEVPFHRLYVRRNGKACWCGNSWWVKDNAYKWLATLLERYGVPPLFLFYDNNAYQGNQVEELKKVVKNIQSATMGLLPRASKEGLEFWSQTLAGTNAQLFIDALGRFDADIAKALLQPSHIGVTTETKSQGSGGSMARSNVHFKSFMMVISEQQRELAQLVNSQIIPQLCDLNFPSLKSYPELEFLDVDDETETAIFTLWKDLVTGKVVGRIEDDERHIRKSLGFPENEGIVLEPLPADAMLEAKAKADVEAVKQPKKVPFEEQSAEMRTFAETNGGTWVEVQGHQICVRTN